ncbi:MAG: hypothetical protein ACJ8FO_05925 [Sphingomicrobium sp.]
MKRLLATMAMGASLISVSALAQAPNGDERGGMMQRDETRTEAQQRADMMFQMLDANHDGTVTRAEADQAVAQFMASRGGDTGRGGGRIQRTIDQAFATSQSLTVKQFEAHALARFDALDLNHDGTVTAAERQQVRAQRQAQAQVQPQAAAPAPQAAPAKPQ